MLYLKILLDRSNLSNAISNLGDVVTQLTLENSELSESAETFVESIAQI